MSLRCAICDAAVSRFASECKRCGSTIVLQGPEQPSFLAGLLGGFLLTLSGFVLMTGFVLVVWDAITPRDWARIEMPYWIAVLLPALAVGWCFIAYDKIKESCNPSKGDDNGKRKI